MSVSLALMNTLAARADKLSNADLQDRIEAHAEALVGPPQMEYKPAEDDNLLELIRAAVASSGAPSTGGACGSSPTNQRNLLDSGALEFLIQIETEARKHLEAILGTEAVARIRSGVAGTHGSPADMPLRLVSTLAGVASTLEDTDRLTTIEKQFSGYVDRAQSMLEPVRTVPVYNAECPECETTFIASDDGGVDKFSSAIYLVPNEDLGVAAGPLGCRNCHTIWEGELLIRRTLTEMRKVMDAKAAAYAEELAQAA